ncbi:ergosterol biosynthesis ERG4/ERG24 [Chytriomyces sp. MP71]|nr:ergosterol biosynthesis ERG4/ERG24 [Chytriomyces sp. MP71]
MEAFNGSWFNPRVAGVDVKMALYCIGAVILQLNVLSQAALHQQNNGGVIANSVFLYVSMFTWFLIEYSYFENVHLYTYDLFAEKIGIKLVFGCMAFYPFFYAIGGTVLTTYAPHRHPELFMQDLGPISCCAIVVLFVTGWVFTRGANMQKFYYKINPKDQTFLFGLLSQKTIPGSRIIASGFWGLSRHINYMGEIVQAVALALPGFFAFVGTDFSLALIPFLYPLYYLALFIPRERDDHVICKRKYGKVWDEYCARVPYRIVPGLY